MHEYCYLIIFVLLILLFLSKESFSEAPAKILKIAGIENS